jgi:putative tryptophan/tyrosine transport system substrate-binding protein
MQLDQVKRRDFIALLGGVVAAWPLAVRAQPGERMRRVGMVMGYPESDPAAQAQVAAFRQELRRLGWEEGRNAQIDVRFLQRMWTEYAPSSLN